MGRASYQKHPKSFGRKVVDPTFTYYRWQSVTGSIKSLDIAEATKAKSLGAKVEQITVSLF